MKTGLTDRVAYAPFLSARAYGYTHTGVGLRGAIGESIEVWQEMGALSYPPDTTRLINPGFVNRIAESAPC